MNAINIITLAEMRDKVFAQLKNIDFGTHLATRSSITRRAIEKAITIIDMKFERASRHQKPLHGRVSPRAQPV